MHREVLTTDADRDLRQVVALGAAEARGLKVGRIPVNASELMKIIHSSHE